MPFHHRWALIDGLNKAYAKEDEPEEPRAPLSWGDRVVDGQSMDNLAALGIQVSDETN